MLNRQVYDGVASVPQSVHEPAPAGLYWKATEATPDVASAASPLRSTAPLSTPAGTLIVALDGAVLSTRTVW